MPVSKKTSTAKKTVSKSTKSVNSKSTPVKKSAVAKTKVVAKPKTSSSRTVGASKTVTKTSEPPKTNKLPLCLKDLPAKLEKFANDNFLDISNEKKYGDVFEQYMVEVFKLLPKIKDVKWKGMPGDKGVDISYKTTERWTEEDLFYDRTVSRTYNVSVQCKFRMNQTINDDPILKAHKTLSNYDKAICITTTRFNEEAVEVAKRYKIKLYDGERLYKDLIEPARKKGFKY